MEAQAGSAAGGLLAGWNPEGRPGPPSCTRRQRGAGGRTDGASAPRFQHGLPPGLALCGSGSTTHLLSSSIHVALSPLSPPLHSPRCPPDLSLSLSLSPCFCVKLKPRRVVAVIRMQRWCEERLSLVLLCPCDPVGCRPAVQRMAP